MSTKKRAPDSLAELGVSRLWTTADVAKYTNYSRWTIYRAVDCGALVAVGGRKKLFRKEDVERWLNAAASPPPPSPRVTELNVTERLRVLRHLRTSPATG